jgi:molecular chaperone DnaJ
MDVKECYRILRVEPGAGIDEIKASFRKLAFKLHPDLNPDNPHAARQFQRLNEAYVILREAVGDGEKKFNKAQRPKAGKKAEPSSRGAESKAGPFSSGPFTAGPAGARQEKQKAGPRQGATAGAGRAKASAGAARAGAARAKTAGAGAKAGGAKVGGSKANVFGRAMNDPFARRVFSDIHDHIRSGDKGPAKKRELSLRWGEKQLRLDLSRGLFSGLKGWLKRQMDDEQTVFLSPSQLMPGSKIRVQVRRAGSGKPMSVEIPLPRDYIVGRPLRLKGLGRKIGPMRGDLFLRLLAK